MQNARIKPPSMEDVASMLQASGLKAKLIFTFAMIAIFRLGVHLPLFGIDNQIFARIAQGNNIIGFIDLFSGGALQNISILALGIGPYITASIIMQLLTVVIPHLEQLQKKRAEPAEEKSPSIRVFSLCLLRFFSLHCSFSTSCTRLRQLFWLIRLYSLSAPQSFSRPVPCS